MLLMTVCDSRDSSQLSSLYTTVNHHLFLLKMNLQISWNRSILSDFYSYSIYFIFIATWVVKATVILLPNRYLLCAVFILKEFMVKLVVLSKLL